MITRYYTHDKTITELFEQVASICPENIAVYLDKATITYRKFNEDVNQYAHYLREKGVTRNLIVAVIMSRSYDMLCAIFAIIKAGGTYLPISPDYPEKRKRQILETARAQFLIIESNSSRELNDVAPILLLPNEDMGSYSKKNLVSINEPNDIVYTIFTSGSTGIPKGVMIAHHSLVNRIEWMQNRFPLNAEDVLFQKTHCGFDVSIWEIFWWSITGAGLTLLPSGKEDNIILMLKTIMEKKVTVIHFVPPVLRIFLDYLAIGNKASKADSLRFVFSSGEALDAHTVNHFNELFHQSEYPQLVNLYGPTEATIDVTYFICEKKTYYHEIPIGKPIDNVELIVLDEFGEPLQPGQVGELYLSGVCLAKGYLNDPERTKQSFLQLTGEQNKIIYKTGDLVKWNNQGELCYLGRKDQQVKINGIRIELGEIEHQLKSNNNIAQAVVLFLTLPNAMQKLVAFIKLRNEFLSLDEYAVKSYLQDCLPHYMIPTDYVVMNEFPLKENGKLNRKKLAEEYELSLGTEEKLG